MSIREGGDISVEEAKRRLLDWSEQADEAIHQQVQGVVATAKAGALKAVPWAAGAAMVMGLFAGGGKGKREGHTKGVIGTAIGVASTAIRVGMFVLPLVRSFLASRRAREE